MENDDIALRHCVLDNGRINLILSDSLLTLPILPKVDLIVTDNPYPLTSGGKNTGGMRGIFDPARYNNSGQICKCDIKFSDWLPLAYDVLKPNSQAYFFANSKNVFPLYNEAIKSGFDFHNLLSWDKGTKTPNRWYMNCYEFILFFKKGKAKTINKPGSCQKLEYKNPRNKDHPNQKPVELFEEFILNSSQPDDIVLDPFMGTGASALAAIKTGRQYYGIEIDNDNFLKAVDKVRFELANRK